MGRCFNRAALTRCPAFQSKAPPQGCALAARWFWRIAKFRPVLRLPFSARSTIQSLDSPLSRSGFRRFETRSPFDKKLTGGVIFVFNWAARLAYSCPIRKEASLQNL